MDPFLKRMGLAAWALCGVVGALVLLTVLGPLAQRTVSSTVCQAQTYDHTYYPRTQYSRYGN